MQLRQGRSFLFQLRFFVTGVISKLTEDGLLPKELKLLAMYGQSEKNNSNWRSIKKSTDVATSS